MPADDADPQLRLTATLQPDPDEECSGSARLARPPCTEHPPIVGARPSPQRGTYRLILRQLSRAASDRDDEALTLR